MNLLTNPYVIGALIIVIVILAITAMNNIDKESKRKEQAKIDATNQDWLTKNHLPDSTNRSIIQIYFGVGGVYNIGVPKIDWSEGELILSVHMGKKLIDLDADLSGITWVVIAGIIQPTARFIYSEEFLNQQYHYEHYYYDSLKAAVSSASIKKIFGLASSIEITVSSEQFKIIEQSKI